MDCLLKNRVSKIKIPKKDILAPIYEAINNSLQSISLAKQTNGYVNVLIKKKLDVMNDDDNLGIEIIEIEDNGIGFNEANFSSFLKLDSDYKQDIGGKGIGRLFWLYAFNKVHVDSVYCDDTFMRQRTFDFDVDNEVTNITNKQINTPGAKNKTTIKIYDVKTDYLEASAMTKAQVLDALGEKFLSILLEPACPTINISFDGEHFTKLNDYISSSIKETSEDYPIVVDGNKIKGKGYLIESSKGEHTLFICAQGITVKEIKLESLLDLPKSFDGNTKIQFFLSGDSLDSDVNESRNDFNTFVFDKDIGSLETKNLYPATIFVIKDFIKPFLEKHKAEKFKKTFEYIRDEEPQYSYLLKNKKDLLENIPLKCIENKEKLSVELFKIDKQVNDDNNSKMDSFLSSNQLINPKVIEEITNNVSESAKTDLARYVIRREQVIKLLGKVLELYSQGKYRNETILHNLFVPQRKDSSNLRYDDHNLWLIDERLAYDYYIFSDEPFKKIISNPQDENNRPDALFTEAVSFTEKEQEQKEIKSITIIEFKKPGRDDYSSSDNPIDQVNGYLDNIKKSMVIIGQDGKHCSVDENASFNVYIISDITPSLLTMIRQKAFQKLPDGNGYYFDNPNFKAHIEIIPYLQIQRNAELRNKAFLNKIKKDISNVDFLSGKKNEDQD